MPNDKIRNPGGPSLGSRLNHQSRTRQAGYSKTNTDEVRLFKQRLKDGVGFHAAREGTKISERMGKEIVRGRTWASVIVLVMMAAVTMGNGCDLAGGGSNQNEDDREFCRYVSTPLCEDVPYDYACLCLTGSAAVTSVNDERELYRPTPTPGYEYEGGDEGLP